MKLQLKRSNVVNSGSAKQPTAGQMEYGELAVNYSQEDPAIFLKDSNNNIVRIAGLGSEGSFDGDYNSLTNKPTLGDGTLTINDSDGVEIGTFTANQTGDATLALPANFSGNYNDLINTPTIGDGTLTISDADGNQLGTFTANQVGNVSLTLPATFSGDYDDLSNKPTIGDGTITLEADGTQVGTFTVNQTGDTTLNIPATSWGDVTDKPIYIDTTEPSSPDVGDLWVDLGECPPELKIWSDCSGSGQWESIEGGQPLTVITPALSGNPSEGEVLTSSEGQGVGGKSPYTYVYNFLDENDNQLQSTSSRTYTLTSADVGKTISVTVTATDSRTTVLTSEKSNAIGPVVPPESVNTPTLLTPGNSTTDVSNSSIVLSCSAYSGVSSTYGLTTWQISTTSDFSSIVFNVTNTSQTSTLASVSLAYSTTHYARCKHTSNTGISSAYSNINSFETQATPVDPIVPTSSMNGLRFDSSRETYLGKDFTTSGSTTTWTFSCWTKLTSSQQQQFLQSRQSSNATDANIGVASNGSLRIVTGTSDAFNGSDALPLNEWIHIVVSFDTANPTASERVKYYVNGLVPSGTYNAPPQNQEYGIGSASPHDIGRHSVNDADYLNGYLSDVYFIDGQVIAPTAFGKTFPDGRWGPIDNSVVKSNINTTASPYDQRANTSQVWSTFVTADNSQEVPGNNRGLAFLFDGRTDTSVSPPGGTCNVDFTNNPSGSYEIFLDVEGDSSAVINDSITYRNTYGWVYVTGNALTKVQLNQPGNSKSFLNAVKLDGRLLVNSGVWNNSQQFSDGSLSNAGTDGDPAEAFDSSTVRLSDAAGITTANGQQITYTLPTPIAYTSSVEIAGYKGSSGEGYANIGIADPSIGYPGNGASLLPTAGIDTEVAWTTIASGSGTFSNFTIRNPSERVGVVAVRVDGVLLVDEGEQWNTSQLWSEADSYWNNAFNNTNPNSNGYITGPSLSESEGIPTKTLVLPVAVSGTWELYASSNSGTSSTGGSIVLLDAADNVLGTVDCNNTATSPEWKDLGNLTNVKKIQLAQDGSEANTSAVLGAVKVSGQTLVNAAGFGDNGFALPFDPTATGVTYSGDFVASDPVVLLDEGLFNGDLTNGIYFATPGNTATAELTLATPITTTGTIAVTYNGGGSSRKIGFNNQAGQTFMIGTGAPVRVADLSCPTIITSIQIEDFPSQSASARILGLSVDGVLIIDSDSVAIDDSGKGNNFHDNNFALGNGSKNWSSLGDGPSSGSQELPENDPPIGYRTIFDGTLNSFMSPSGGGATASVNFTGMPNGTYEVKILAINSSTVEINGVTYQDEDGWVTLAQNALISIVSTQTAGDAAYVYAIKLDGKLLVDSNRLDSVTDTPLKNYAVLRDLARNGNLDIQTTNGTYGTTTSTLGMTSGKYYWEVLVTNDDGSIEVGISSEPNPNPLSSLGAASAGYSYLSQNAGTGALYHNGVITPAYGPTYTVGDLIGVIYDADTGTLEFTVNGVNQGVAFSGLTGEMFAGISDSSGGVGSAASINFGQQPFTSPSVTYDQATGLVELAFNQPYDYRPNTDQLWSSQCSGSSASGTTPEFAFNADTSNSNWVTSSNAVWSASFTNVTKLEMKLRTESAASGLPAGATITVSGTGIETTAVTSVGSFTEIPLTSSTIGTITIAGDSQVSAGLAGVKVNGRLLVDNGVWNVNQNWSDAYNGTFSSGTPADSFSGDPTNELPYLNTANSLTFAPFGGIAGITSFTAKGGIYTGGSSNWNIDITYLDGTTQTITAPINNLAYNTIDLVAAGYNTSKSGLKSMTVNATTNGSVGNWGINNFAINGALLVDGGAQWDTSQDWSSTTTATNIAGNFNGAGPAPSRIANIFNGDTTTGLYPQANQVSNINLSSTPLPGVNSKYEIYLGLSGNQNATGATYNGSTTIPGLGPSGWYTLTAPVNSIELANTAGNFQYGLHAIRIDGILMVDPGAGTHNTLFQTWDQAATRGIFFYDENAGKTISSFELTRKYGLTVASPDAGIYDLTFQPRSYVLDYLKQATAYLPLEDLLPQLETAERSLASTQVELSEAQAALNTATEGLAENLTARATMQTDLTSILARLDGLESDEIVDDATATTLITALAALVARVDALENP